MERVIVWEEEALGYFQVHGVNLRPGIAEVLSRLKEQNFVNIALAWNNKDSFSSELERVGLARYLDVKESKYGLDFEKLIEPRMPISLIRERMLVIGSSPYFQPRTRGLVFMEVKSYQEYTPASALEEIINQLLQTGAGKFDLGFIKLLKTPEGGKVELDCGIKFAQMYRDGRVKGGFRANFTPTIHQISSKDFKAHANIE